MYTLLSIAKTQQLHFSHEFIPLYVSYNCNHSHEKPLATVTQIHVIPLCVSLFILLARCHYARSLAYSLCIVSLYIHDIRGGHYNITVLQYNITKGSQSKCLSMCHICCVARMKSNECVESFCVCLLVKHTIDHCPFAIKISHFKYNIIQAFIVYANINKINSLATHSTVVIWKLHLANNI